MYAHKYSALVRQFYERNAFTQFHKTSTVEPWTPAHGWTDGCLCLHIT